MKITIIQMAILIKTRNSSPSEREIEESKSEITVLIACHRSSLLILDCISSITPSNGEASLLGEESEAELLPCFSMAILHWRIRKMEKTGKCKTHASYICPFYKCKHKSTFYWFFRGFLHSKSQWLVDSK